MAAANGAERMILSNLPVVRQSHTYSGGRSLRRRLSTFPVDKPFEKLEPAAPIAEVVLRLVVDLYSEAPLVVGSATVLCGHLLVTAKHVLLSVPGCAASSSVGATSRDRASQSTEALPLSKSYPVRVCDLGRDIGYCPSWFGLGPSPDILQSEEK